MKNLRTYKEELVAITLISLLLLLVRWLGRTYWPTTGQYDLAAETDTVFYATVPSEIYTTSAWLALRVVLPKGYRYLKSDVYNGFDKMTGDQKMSLSMRTFAMLLLSLVLLAMSACNTASAAAPYRQRDCVVSTAQDAVGVREATGHNDGPEVEEYLAFVHLKKGAPWCAAFVSYHLSACGVRNPSTGWSPAFSGVSARVWTPRKASRMPMPGDVFSLYFESLGRVGHVGIVTGFDGRYITTVEGNTSEPGSRDGDGVYARRRQLSKVYAITNYIQDAGAVRATGTGSVQDHAPGNDGYRLAYRDHRRQNTSGYAAARTTGSRASNPAFARAGAGRAATDEDQRSRHQYAERAGRASRSGLRVRQRCHQGEALGHLDQGAPGHDGDHCYQGGEDTLAMVVLRSAGVGCAGSSFPILHQTLLER
ncbi:MAG: CHAP domain-containing protein [Flavobacteriales bacterium]|nr:CHAP domain-containing protein [Flavobacteriales bacterium]